MPPVIQQIPQVIWQISISREPKPEKPAKKEKDTHGTRKHSSALGSKIAFFQFVCLVFVLFVFLLVFLFTGCRDLPDDRRYLANKKRHLCVRLHANIAKTKNNTYFYNLQKPTPHEYPFCLSHQTRRRMARERRRAYYSCVTLKRM